MKTNCWLVLGMVLATSAVAQVNTNKLPEIPAPANVAPAPAAVAVATNEVAPAPKKKAAVVHKKKVVKKISEPTVTLVAGPATVASPNLNLRGQAGLKGEVVGHLKLGDAVTIVSPITLDKHAADEPAQWAKILLPSGTKVWVSAHFVDATNKVVTAKKLNLRAGPGENFSVLGVLEKGAAISEITTKGSWIQIEAPSSAVAYVAAMFLKQEAAPAAVPTIPAPAVVEPVVTTPAPTTTSTVAEAQPIVTQPTTPVVTTPPVDNSQPVATVVGPTDATAFAAALDTNAPPLPPRISTHEGYVRASTSIVAPTPYELYDSESGNTINFLFATTSQLDLSRYSGMKIIVTGEEGISPRWPDVPVLSVQKILVTSSNPPPDYKKVSSPHASQPAYRASKPMQRR
jgi:uncharacterized protein YgiM (DUF1202 family)